MNGDVPSIALPIAGSPSTGATPGEPSNLYQPRQVAESPIVVGSPVPSMIASASGWVGAYPLHIISRPRENFGRVVPPPVDPMLNAWDAVAIVVDWGVLMSVGAPLL